MDTMDTENELKYLLPVDFNNSALSNWKKSVIMQGYLNEATAVICRAEDGTPAFVVSVETQDGDEIVFSTNKISEYQYKKLRSHARSYEEDLYLLPNSTRIRNQSGKLSITYKQWIDGELIEIEDKENVTQEIFDAFQPYAADFVYKDRYETMIDDEEWVVDYLRDYNTQAVYYTHSEVEMPADRKEPLYMPQFIKNAYLFAVPQDDIRFTNQRLSDQPHAKSLYQKYTAK